jgi:trehalose 6-phosphate phosphatase
MRHILARRNRGVLERFAGPRTLLAFDFDGTLAPIVADPERAAMRASTRRLLADVAKRSPCVVISGRSRDDVRRRVLGVKLAKVIGNHGLEPGAGRAEARSAARRWVSVLEKRLTGLRGVVIEDKGLSVAIHYRAAHRKEGARARILDATAGLGDVRLLVGLLVVDVLPAGTPGKGQALERAMERLGCDTAVYVGDDETDEDVFSLDLPRNLLGIRVGRKATSSADYYLRRQAEIDGLLRAFLAGRPGSRSPRTRSR